MVGKHYKVISVILAYCVPKSSQPGPFTSAFQQKAILLARHDKRKHPRDIFVEDYIEFVQKLQVKGDKILIGMDANAEIGED